MQNMLSAKYNILSRLSI